MLKFCSNDASGFLRRLSITRLTCAVMKGGAPVPALYKFRGGKDKRELVSELANLVLPCVCTLNSRTFCIMSTYSEESFDSDFYQKNRPTYPESLYEAIKSYHDGVSEIAIDIGCGTGISTFPLLRYFSKVFGLDPSPTMLTPANKCKEDLKPEDRSRIEFKVCAAEKLSTLFNEDSIDIVVGAESIHWVDHRRFFEEAHRVLRPHGTIAYWFYVEPIFLDFPEANEIYEKYVYEDPAYMGPLWKPGKEYLRLFGETIRIPDDKFYEIKKHIYRPLKSEHKTAYFEQRNSYTLGDFRRYLRSWSAYHTWQQIHGGPDRDIAEMLIDELKLKCNWGEETTKLRVEWGTAYYMARKRPTR
ncbi:LANO_0F05446g1_1 [Lachancea nothofagi CBS 11611]|uniref:LANO_0F05446g1_1 n=1 Tax=Lachancea nothofagi CBS 11611 TaxID=1266666 RepID=A0A1G4K860_9SACH|nr:LANO_0F05446g1_1 [Lachancea nothofagi CBS 11611]